MQAPGQQTMVEGVEQDPAKVEKLKAIQKLMELATPDRTKFPPGYISYYCCNPVLFILAPFYTFPLSPHWAAAALEHRGECLGKPCLNEPGYDNEWAVPIYAAPLGMGREGKICEDPGLACITLAPYLGWIVWCRNNERVELELIDGRQMWPSAVRDYTRSEHCEGHFGAWCIMNYYTLCIPCCIEAAIGGCCDCCCCYTARRRKKLRDRYKLKGTVCTDYLLQCPMWCVIGGCAFNAYQEAMELGKQQGYEVPLTTTAGGGGLVGLVKSMLKKGDDAAPPSPQIEEGEGAKKDEKAGKK